MPVAAPSRMIRANEVAERMGLEAMVPVSRVSRLMGHANEAITLGVYAHEIERHENAERTRESMRLAFGSGTNLERSGEETWATEPGTELPKVASLRAVGDT